MPGQTTRLAIRITAEDDQASAKIIKLGDVAERTARRASASMDKAGSAVDAVGSSGGAATAKVVKLGDVAQQAGDKAAASMNKAGKSLADFNKAASGALSGLRTLGSAAVTAKSRILSVQGALVGLGVGLGVRQALADFRDFDLGLRGVGKTTTLTQAELDDFGRRIQDMSLTASTSASRLLEISEAAGQLGVDGAGNLLVFTKTLSQLETATDMAGQEAAMQLARLLNVTGETADQVDVLGSVIVALGNNMAATESEITRMGTEIGQATAAYRVSSAEATAMGAALRSMGVQAELGGSAVGRTFRAIDATIRSGGRAFTYLQALTGQTGDALRRTFATDSTQVFRLFVEGLGRAMAGGESAAAVLDAFQLSGEEILKVLPTIGQHAEELARALSIANEETRNASALAKEAAARQEAFDAQLRRGANAVTLIATTLGEELAPSLGNAVDEFVAWTKANDDFLRQDVAGHIRGIAGSVVTLGKDLVDLGAGFAALPAALRSGLLAGGGTLFLTRNPYVAGAAALTGAYNSADDSVSAKRRAAYEALTKSGGWTGDGSPSGIGSLEDVLRQRLPSPSLGVDWTKGGGAFLDRYAVSSPLAVQDNAASNIQTPLLPGYQLGAPAVTSSAGSASSSLTPPDAAAEKEAQKLADERVRIEEDLTNRIEELTLDRYTHQRVLLERELADIRSKDGYKTADAATQKAIEDQLAEYKTAKLAEIAAAEDKYLQEQAKKRAEAAETALRESDDMWAGIASGFEKSLPKMESGFERMERMSKATFSSIGTASTTLMANIFKGNIHSMEDAAVSALNTLIDAVAQAQSQIWGQALAAGISSAGTYFFGSGDSGTTTVPATTSPTIMVAHGGSFASRSLADYESMIVTSPTLFRFASGGVGLMGEESGAPGEAVMPLTRLPGGDLGVRASTPGRASGDTVVNIQVNNNTGNDTQASATASRGRNGEINVVVQLETALAQRINYGQGKLGSVLQSTYGLSRTGRTI
jgi:TP901 family phage tail tape measure protein